MGQYLVRQYAPSFCEGFDLDVVTVESRDDILKVYWLDRFKHDGFKEFYLKPYRGDELIFGALYDGDDIGWVAGFALPLDSNQMSNNGDLLRDNWRYKPHKS